MFTLLKTELLSSEKLQPSSYSSIFNIVNVSDLVPYLPLKYWGFEKYGVVKQNYLNLFDSLYWTKKGIDGLYQTSNVSLVNAVSVFKNISKDRNSCYYFLYDEKGNVIDDMTKIYYKKLWDAKRFKTSLYNDDFYKYLPKHMLKYICFDSNLSVDGKVVVYQKPIFFMQVLAGVCASDEHYNKIEFICGTYSAPMYSDAKFGMAFFSILSDFMNPHFVDGYIIIAET